mgnify:CR=1 FL=1
MASANRYSTSWEGFWSTLSGTSGEIFWDADPAHASQQELGLFQSYIDPQLPLIDLGCGNGTQTRFLAKHFAKVMGTEISPAAIEIARTKNGAPNISYRLLDVLCPVDAQALHEEVGDANLYIRGVLHQLSPAKQAHTIESIDQLLGGPGNCEIIEI